MIAYHLLGWTFEEMVNLAARADSNHVKKYDSENVDDAE